MSNNTFRYAVVNLLLVSLTFFFGCAGAQSGQRSGGRYIYNYTMTEPAANDQLMFKDDYITIQFKFDESAVKFQLQNISDVPISIQWEQASLALNGRVFPVRNTATLYQTGPSPAPSVLIPPLGFVRDLVIPREYIAAEKGVWAEKDIFPTDDQGSPARKKLIMKYNGSQVKLLLPIRIGEVVQEYAFNFKVKGISMLAPNKIPAPKERPAAPPLAVSTGSDPLVPVLVAGGILAIAIYVFSQEKSSPLNF